VRSRFGDGTACADWQNDRVDDIDAFAMLCSTGCWKVGIRGRFCECRGLLTCEAAPFTEGVVQVILGRRNRGNSVTDLVFAMAVVCCGRDMDCATCEARITGIRVGDGGLGNNIPGMFR
jgi:hypothetical protein